MMRLAWSARIALRRILETADLVAGVDAGGLLDVLGDNAVKGRLWFANAQVTH